MSDVLKEENKSSDSFPSGRCCSSFVSVRLPIRLEYGNGVPLDASMCACVCVSAYKGETSEIVLSSDTFTEPRVVLQHHS